MIMIISQLIPWLLAISGFVVFFFPRILVPVEAEFTDDQVINRGKFDRTIVKWYPFISFGYLALIIGICAISIFITKVNPYPEGLSIIALFWGGLGICESVFSLLSKVMSVSNRLQYRYIEVDSSKITRLLKIQLAASLVIVFLVITYLAFL